nr:hypothetical protein [Rosenbergiella nectarea]
MSRNGLMIGLYASAFSFPRLFAPRKAFWLADTPLNTFSRSKRTRAIEICAVMIDPLHRIR